MAKGKQKLPDRPTYYTDPRFTKGLDDMFKLGGRLTSFDFTGDLEPLADTISTSPETTKLFMEGLKAELDPIYRDLRKDVINQLAANNQLESSVTADRLSDLAGDINKQYVSQSTQFGLADIDRALRNRISLLTTGIGLTDRATGMAGNEQARRNEFAMRDYENVVADQLYQDEKKNEGWGGLFSGAGGGALVGAALAPFTAGLSVPVAAGAGALLGGAAGYFNPDIGDSLLGAGGAATAIGKSKSSYAMPGSYASDDPFDRYDFYDISSRDYNKYASLL